MERNCLLIHVSSQLGFSHSICPSCVFFPPLVLRIVKMCKGAEYWNTLTPNETKTSFWNGQTKIKWDGSVNECWFQWVTPRSTLVRPLEIVKPFHTATWLFMTETKNIGCKNSLYSNSASSTKEVVVLPTCQNHRISMALLQSLKATTEFPTFTFKLGLKRLNSMTPFEQNLGYYAQR